MLLYSGAHGLTGRAVGGRRRGRPGRPRLAAEARARRAEAAAAPPARCPRRYPALRPAALRRRAEDSVMARITAAVRARAEAEAAARAGDARRAPRR